MNDTTKKLIEHHIDLIENNDWDALRMCVLPWYFASMVSVLIEADIYPFDILENKDKKSLFNLFDWLKDLSGQDPHYGYFASDIKGVGEVTKLTIEEIAKVAYLLGFPVYSTKRSYTLVYGNKDWLIMAPGADIEDALYEYEMDTNANIPEEDRIPAKEFVEVTEW